MGDDELWRQTATELALRIRRRELSATEVVGAHLARIDAVNPELNAIVTLDREGALAAADEADRVLARGEPTGVLHGLPIAVKDLEDTAGMRTTYGSPIFRDHVPAADTLLVTRLRRAGAIVIGKTNTPEFGAGSQTFNSVFGATRNPFDHSRTPGGSSGGAAAAVASGMLPLADGSDLGGSVRNPAAFCGLVGLRPSPGPDSRGADDEPVEPAAPCSGRSRAPSRTRRCCCARSAGPTRARRSRSTILPRRSRTSSPADLGAVRIAWSDDLGGLPVEPEVTAVLRRRRGELEALGCTIEDAEPDLRAADEAFETLRGVGFAHGVRRAAAQPARSAQGHGGLEHRGRLGADRRAGRSRARPAGGGVRAHAGAARALRRARAARHPGGAVRRRRAVAARGRRGPDGAPTSSGCAPARGSP